MNISWYIMFYAPQLNICYTYACNIVMILVILQVFYKIFQCDKPLKL